MFLENLNARDSMFVLFYSITYFTFNVILWSTFVVTEQYNLQRQILAGNSFNVKWESTRFGAKFLLYNKFAFFFFHDTWQNSNNIFPSCIPYFDKVFVLTRNLGFFVFQRTRLWMVAVSLLFYQISNLAENGLRKFCSGVLMIPVERFWRRLNYCLPNYVSYSRPLCTQN